MKRKVLLLLFALIFIGVIGGFGAWYYWTHRYDKQIVTVARKYDLDPALIKSIIYEESFFNPRAQSAQNAVGLMQVTPVAAQEWMASTRSRTLREAIATVSKTSQTNSEPSFEEAFSDPEISLHAGCWYLQSLLNRYREESNRLAVALAAYNAGPTNVERWAPNSERSNLSQEEFIARIEFPVTRNYVQKIIERYNYYKRDADLKSAGGE